MPNSTKTDARPVTTSRMRADAMHAIEGAHFGRCIEQAWDPTRQMLFEVMDYPKARCLAVIVKRFQKPVPKPGSGGQWPDLASAEVYLPVDDKSASWVGLDMALRKYEAEMNRKARLEETESE